MQQRVAERLERLYGTSAPDCLPKVLACIDRAAIRIPPAQQRSWDQTDVVLITYGDMVRREEASSLAALSEFLVEQNLHELISTVHILPFYPHSSDDGFSVIDYQAVDPVLGSWDDVTVLSNKFRLAFDLVLNHISSQSEWFAGFLRGEEPFSRFFHTVNPGADLSAVIRPRSLPLLTAVETREGTRHVWTTFSEDQIDLNFAEPDLLVAMLEVLLDYVARGAQIIRLDAIAFLWKEIGTSCLHLPQTHEVVKLMRDVLTAVAPHVWLLTETNVPHEENISYFGDGDEAQLVYQFSLPPLLLDAFTEGNATPLMGWLRKLEPPPQGTTYLNFTASHDGIGVRALEGIVSEEEVADLVSAVRKRGGLVSTRHCADGTDVPYELNIAFVDALAPDDAGDTEYHARRFLASQAVMLALQGIPAIYFHSLVGSRNDSEGAASSGQPRRINRRKFERQELDAQLASPGSLAARIYQGYRRLLAVRRCQPAFHPDASQTALDTGNPALIGFLRESRDPVQKILVLVNVSHQATHLPVDAWLDHEGIVDLLGDHVAVDAKHVTLEPGRARWLTPSREK